MPSRLPAAATESVWSLAALPNGDIACGCSDNLVWIFSRRPERAASEAVVAEYDQLVADRRQVSSTRSAAYHEPVADCSVPKQSIENLAQRRTGRARYGGPRPGRGTGRSEARAPREHDSCLSGMSARSSFTCTRCGFLTYIVTSYSGLRVAGMSSARWSKLQLTTHRRPEGLAKRCSSTASTTTLSFPSMSEMMRHQFRSLTTTAVWIGIVICT
jgi:hypothetical protein